MRHTVKVLSYLLISSIFTSIVFAGDSVKNRETDSVGEPNPPLILPVPKNNVHL